MDLEIIEKRALKSIAITHTWEISTFVEIEKMAKKRGLNFQGLISLWCADELERIKSAQNKY